MTEFSEQTVIFIRQHHQSTWIEILDTVKLTTLLYIKFIDASEVVGSEESPIPPSSSRTSCGTSGRGHRGCYADLVESTYGWTIQFHMH